MNNKSKIVITIIITILVLVFIGTAGVTFYYLRKNDNTMVILMVEKKLK